MKKIFILIIISVAVIPVFAQKKSDSKTPDEQIKVKRQYDDKGNLIGYDSTYVKSWSSADTTMTQADIEKMQKEMEKFFGDHFGQFFSDSTKTGTGPFGDMHEKFFKHFQEIPHAWGPFDSDSIHSGIPQMPDSTLDFSRLKEMQEEMMKYFGEFFHDNDTIQGNSLPDDDFFFGPQDFEQLRKEFEEHFKGTGGAETQPMNGTTDEKEKPAVLI